jgi:hypothetical protein
MSERSTFIRFVLSGVLTLVGLLLPAGTATATGPLPSKRFAAGASAEPVPSQRTSSGIRSGHRARHRTTRHRISGHWATRHRTTGHRAPGHTFSGDGFDTCRAPGLATMDAWRAHSSYRAVGIYFGGRARACTTQTQLTPDWVRQTTASGWSLLPIYVGSQSPCVTGSNKNPYLIDTKDPAAQGASEGADAVQAAGALGLSPGSALYFDMESYDTRDASCTAATLAYIQAWDRQLSAAGYLSGFYSSADSGVAHLESARRAGAADLPDAIWYARWGVSASLVNEPSLAATAWTPHARIHQYHGSVSETYGGKSLSIDRDLIDAPVAVVG